MSEKVEETLSLPYILGYDYLHTTFCLLCFIQFILWHFSILRPPYCYQTRKAFCSNVTLLDKRDLIITTIIIIILFCCSNLLWILSTVGSIISLLCVYVRALDMIVHVYFLYVLFRRPLNTIILYMKEMCSIFTQFLRTLFLLTS